MSQPFAAPSLAAPAMPDSSARMRLNEEKLKLFMSLSPEPIPDIVNEPETNIFSHFKFYFNDS
jgi:hypothetical protein